MEAFRESDSPRKKWRRLITFGTFDLLHFGHMRFLAKLKELADEVFVGLAADEIVALGKKRKCFYSYEIRKEMLLHTRYVDHVLNHSGPVDSTGRVMIVAQKMEFIRQHNIELIVMGSDWTGEYEFMREHCDVLYLERTPGISTSQILNSDALSQPR